jgi:exosortase
MFLISIDKPAILSNLKAHKYAYLLVTLLVVASIPTLAALVQDWSSDGNYSHGFLIIPISLWLFWRQRHDLVFPAKPSTGGMALFIAGCGCLILGMAASEFFTTRVSLVIILTGISLYYLGWPNFRKVWFAFFFLLFMIPIPATIYYSLTLPLQFFASKVTVHALHVVGVPCLQKGNIIQLPDYRLEVLEACSGLRSLVTLMALGALYGNLSMPGKVRPIILFLATIPIAIVTNIFRIFITAIAAYAISTEIAEDFLHELSGLIVFGTALILTLILGALLKWRRNRSS